MDTRDLEQFDGPWLGYEDAAKHSGLSHEYLRKLVMRGEIDCFRKVGRRVLFSVPELDRWINRRHVAEKIPA